MDTKLTLSFNRDVVEKAKVYAAKNNISLSRLIEHLLMQVTSNNYQSLEDFPIADWVSQVAEGPAVYQRMPKKTSKALKDEFFSVKK